MFKSYFKLSIRNLISQKGYTLINLLGLITGITAFILIVCWIQTELAYDSFHKGKENIYRVDYKLYEEGKLELTSAAAVPAVGLEMKRHFPEVEEYTRFSGLEGVVNYNDVRFKETQIFYAEPSFFSVFSFPLLKGASNKSILAVNHAVLSESAAHRYFGNADPIGKVICFNGKDKYEVSGVAKDAPDNSHFKFDILFSYQNLINQNEWYNSGWIGPSDYTYVRLAPGTNAKTLEAKLPQLPQKFIGDFMKQADFLVEFNLRKLTDIHLHSSLSNELSVNGNSHSVTFLGIIAMLVLLIAYVNYINMTTSRSVERSTEVGVRKVLGALKNHLVSQFLIESMLLNVLALISSIVAVILVKPFFNQITGSFIHFNFGTIALIFIGLLTFATLLTGLLPAIYLSNFIPTAVLKVKGQIGSRRLAAFKNGMVIFQFAISIILISGTILINRQLSFVQHHSLGINIDQTLVIEGPQAIDSHRYRENLQAFKSDLLQQSNVKSMTVSSCIPGKEITWEPVYGKLVDGVNTEKKIDMIGIDEDFMKTYGMNLMVGRNFDHPFEEKITHVILNESAVKYFGFKDAEDAVGKELTSADMGNARIIGVVHDFNHRSLKELPQPILFSNQPWNQFYSLKVNQANLDRLIPIIEQTWKHQFPGNPFRYYLLDDYFNNQYQADRKFGSLFQLFSIIAIFIACLGLLCLSSYTISRRTKEIGVRKVSGANVAEILVLLNKDFMKWVIIGFLIAVPIAWYSMDLWLQNFAYRTSMSWWIFVLAGIISIGIAMLTVSWQSLKAATRNPVEALRYE